MLTRQQFKKLSDEQAAAFILEYEIEQVKTEDVDVLVLAVGKRLKKLLEDKIIPIWRIDVLDEKIYDILDLCC